MKTFQSMTGRTEFLKIVTSAAAAERITGRSITSITRATGTRKVVVVTTVAHGYISGALVYIQGANETEFNTPLGKMVSVIDDTSFALLLDGTTASATGTLSCRADIWVRQASIAAKKDYETDNATGVYVGTKVPSGQQAWFVDIGLPVSLPAPDMGNIRINLGDWRVKVQTDGDGIYVFYS